MKKVLSFLLALVMLFSVVAGLNVTSNAATRSQSEAIEWIKARGNESWWGNIDGAYGCQCVDLIMAFYQYFGYSRLSGNACDYMSNHLPSGSNWHYSSSPTPGCVFVKRADSTYTYGHVGLVYAVSGSTMYTVETNLVSPYDGAQGRANAQFRTRSISFANTFIVPDYITDKTPPSVDNYRAFEFRDGLFTIDAHVTDASGIRSVSYAVWTTNNGQDDLVWYKGNNTGSFGNDHFWTWVAFSEHKNERGTYIMDIYATDNAGNETSKRISYTFPDKAPTVSNIQVTDVSSKGYTVKCTVKSVSEMGVSRVQFPTWTANNGQDDLASEWWTNTKVRGTISGNTVTFRVNASEHKNEKGTYITHIYAYDKIGNTDSVGVSVNVHDHSWNSGVITKAATCTATGTKKFTCSICKETKTETIPVKEHTFVSDKEFCQNGCGTLNPNYQPPHIHNWGSGSIIKAATCLSTGTKKYTCSCGEIKTETIPKTDHNYSYTVVEPLDTSLGYTVCECTMCHYYYKDRFTPPTGKVTGLKCSARTASAMKFTWNKVSGARGYQIEILNDNGDDAGVKTLHENVYTFKKLSAGHAYKARVRLYIKDADGNYFFGPWSEINSPTLPKGTTLTSLARARKAFTAKWKKGTCTGYQLQFGRKANFKGAKTVTFKNVKTVKYTAKQLKAYKYYYVRIRTYKSINGKNYYSAWSAKKSVKTK